MAAPGPLRMERQALCVLILMASLMPTACPTHLQGRAQVRLAWDYPESASPIEGFLVQRRTDTGPWQEIGRVGATLRTATDATAPRNTPLCYQVLAYRGQEHSRPSNEVCLTIPAIQPQARTRLEEEAPGRTAS
jgi:hypothetical protein